MVTTGQVVTQLFARSIAGVFGVRYPTGRMKLRYKRRAPWSLTIGLAARLEADAATEGLGMHSGKRPRISRLVRNCPPVVPTDLELATTDALLSELYRRTRGAWVLGLFRPRRIRGHWTGLCRNGDPVICAGIASLLAEAIRWEDWPADGTPPTEHVSSLFGTVMHSLTSERHPSRTWLAGLTRMAEEVIRGLPGPDATPGDDLKEFVSID